MITKVNTWKEKQDDKVVQIFEFPELDMINSSDPEIQKILIKYGVAVGMPGTHLIFTQAVELRTGSINVQT